jgi:hypothetical protein
MKDRLNFALAADRRFLLRLVDLVDIARLDADLRAHELQRCEPWEPLRVSLDRLAVQVRTALEAVGLTVKTTNRGTDNDDDEIARPFTVEAWDDRDHLIVIDLDANLREWSITEVQVVL